MPNIAAVTNTSSDKINDDGDDGDADDTGQNDGGQNDDEDGLQPGKNHK